MTKTRALSTRRLVALLRQRMGRRPARHTLPGLMPMENFHFYNTLCQVARAMGVRY